MNSKTKITLTPEQETLLIPLYAKGQPGNRLFFDPKAQDILNQVDYDFTRLRVPYKTVILVCQRAKKLDAVTRDFLAEHRRGTVLHLGCGLDSRFWRVDNGKVEWYDLDMPPVIELRQRFYPSSERYHLIASSVTDLEWMEKVTAASRPVLVVAEGLLMYLAEADVKRLVAPTAGGIPDQPVDRGRFQPDDSPYGNPTPIPEANRSSSSDGVLMTPTRSKPGHRVSTF